MECAWFAFSEMFQNELDIVKLEWNNHYIRRSNATKVWGVPDELFNFPQLHGYKEKFVPQFKSDVTFWFLISRDILNDHDELYVYFNYVICNEGLKHPPKDCIADVKIPDSANKVSHSWKSH